MLTWKGIKFLEGELNRLNRDIGDSELVRVVRACDLAEVSKIEQEINKGKKCRVLLREELLENINRIREQLRRKLSNEEENTENKSLKE